MKYLLKRTLALILSVLMVLGTLPTTAWAARVEGEAREEPVVTPGDGVVDTLRKEEGGEKPEKPTDPDDPTPVDPAVADVKITSVDLSSDGTWSMTFHTDMAKNGSTENWTLLIIPDVKHPTSDVAVRPSQMRHDTGDADDRFSTSTNSNISALAGLTRFTGMQAGDYLIVTGSAMDFDENGDITIGSGDFGNAPKWEDLQTSIGTFIDAGNKTVSSMTENMPFLFVLYTQQGTPSLAYYDATMIKRNTDFELVADKTSIDTTSQPNLIFDLQNAETAGVPSVVDKITFTGTLSDGTEYKKEFDAKYNIIINMTPNPFHTDVTSVSQSTGEVGKDFDGARGTVTVEYHKNGSPGEKKTLIIDVAPIVRGKVDATKIWITLRRGETKSGSTTITNGLDIAQHFLSADTYDTFIGESITENGVAPLPDTIEGLTATFNEAVYEDDGYTEEENEDGEYIATFTSEGVPVGVSKEYKNIITVTALADAAKGEHNFDITLNMTDEGYTEGKLTIPVTVIVEVDQEWTVTFDENYEGKPDPMHTETVTDGGRVNYYPASRDGYSLVGWYSKPECADGQAVSFPYTPTEDTTLYAKWSQDLSGVTFDPNGGTVADNNLLNQTGAPGAAVTDPDPTRDGYTLDGWVKEGETAAVAIGTIKFPASGTEKYTAKWTPLYTYKLVYDLKGGSGGPTAPTPDGPTTATSKTWTLTKNPAPTKSGYEFKGWATTDGGTTDVSTVTANAGSTAAGGTITTTVYAIWSQKTFQIKYHYSGAPSGQNPPDAVTVNAADTGDATLENLPTLTGWTITGWFTGTDSAATGTTPATVPLNQANGTVVHLWAKWVRNSYTVTYDVNGGKETYDNGTFTYGSNYTIPAANKPTRDNHRFTGWLATAGATGTYNEGETVTTGAANITLQAQWQGLSWVKFDPNGGKWGAETDPKTYQGDTGDVLDSNHPADPTRDGYTFGGWKLGDATIANDANGIEKETFPATAGAVTADTTKVYVAIWGVQQRTVTFKLNNGTDTTHDTKHTDYNTALGAGNYPANPTRTGYKFAGWFPNAGGTGTEFTNATVVTENRTVYAKWTAQYAYKLVYNANAGTDTTTNIPATATQTWKDGNTHTFTLTFAPKPTRANYTFLGWADANTDTEPDYTDATGGTKTVDVTGTPATEVTKTVYAVWKRNQSSVAFDENGGTWVNTGGAKTQTGNTGENVTMPANPTRTGHTFEGWNTDSSAASGVKTGIKFPANVGDDVTYYATWKPIPYTVTYDGNGGTPSKVSDTVDYDTTVSTLATASRTYYTFGGWFKTKAADGTLSDEFTTSTHVTGNITVYAKWTQKTSNVVVNFKKTAVGASSAADFDVSGEVTLNGTAYKATVTNGHTVKISGVPQGTTSYNVYFAGVDTTETVTVADGTDGADMTTPVTVDFYEMEVKTNDKGTGTVTAANTALVMTDAGVKTTTLSASTTSSAGDKIIVMAGGKVDWSYSETTANYTFAYWDSDTPENKNNNPSVPSASAAASHTAYFTKSSFDAFLVVKSNTKPQIDYTKDIKKVELVDGTGTSLGTPSYDTSHWKVTAISNDKSGSWRVTTVDGGTYTVPMLKDETDQTMDLFGVKVVETKPAGCTAATVTGGTGSSATNRVVVPLGQAVTAAETHDNGYTLKEWKDTADPAKAHVTFSGTNKGTVTLQDNEGTDNDYTNNDDLVITPTYTYEMKINPTRGGATCTTEVTGVQVKNGGTTVTATKGTDNMWTAKGLIPGTTYEIWVNGYKSDKTTNTTTETSTVAVPIWAVIADDEPDGAAATKTVGGAAQVYLPNGADNATGLALAATANAGYRARTATETVKPWAITDGDDGAVSADFSKVTVTDIQADLTVTANFVKRWEITKAMSGNEAGSTVSFGTVTAPDTASGNVATLDEGHVVAITADPSDEQQIQGWAITGGDGKLYSDPDCATAHEIANPAAHTGATVYAKAATADATVTVTFTSRKYNITVKVQKNNADLEGVSVNLYKDGTHIGTAKTTNASGEATFTVTADTYDIYTNATGTMESAEKPVTVNHTDTPDNTASETVRYYTVKVQKATTSGTLPNNTFYANHGTAASSTGETEKVLLAETEARPGLKVTATGNNQSAANGPYYRFLNWSSKAEGDTADTPAGVLTFTGTGAAGTYTLPGENTLKDNTNIKKDNGIIITATYQRQYKVTVDLASGVKTALSTTTYPKISATTQSDWGNYSSANTSVVVDAGSPVYVGYSGGNTVWYFKEWSRAADTGTFNGTTAIIGTELGTKVAGGGTAENSTVYRAPNTFTPTEDSTLYADFWRDASHDEANWTYVQGNASSSDNSAANQNQLGWTANDAQTPVITVKGRKEGSTAVTLTTDHYDAVTADGKTTYTLKTTFLDGLDANETYDVTFTYTLGTAGTNNSRTYADLTRTTQFRVELKTFTLIETEIVVKDGSETLNVHSTGTQDVAQYESHKHEEIKPHNTLTLKWFWSATKPAPKVLNATEIAGINATTPTYPGGATWTPLTGTNVEEGFTGTAAPYTTIPNYDGGGVTALQGKYVFAVATAENTGTGSVITNAIPVDYDAKVTVQVDDAPITDNETRFVVYLRPVTDHTSTENKVHADDIPATWNGTTKRYETTGSKLTGGVTYQVWVNEVSSVTSGDNFFLLNTKKTVSSGPDANQTATVDFYSVNLTNVNAGKVTHAKDDSSPTKKELAEHFDTYPTLSAVVTGTARTVASGAAVLTETKVTASTSTWTQDYKLTWQKSTENDDLEDTDSTQSSGATAATYANGAVTAKTNIGARLDQNTYTIKGDILGSGSLSGATLKFGDYTFDGKATNWTASPDRISFTVPRTGSAAGSAITGTYTLSATAGTNTTVMGYDNKRVSTKPATYPNNTAVTVTTAATQNGKFTVFIESTSLSIKVTDDDDHSAQNANPNATTIPTAEHDSEVVFMNYTASTKIDRTITVSNEGNTPLTVKLTIYKDGTAIMDQDTVLTGDDKDQLVYTTASGETITFGKLQKSFDLAAKTSQAVPFTITASNNLKVKDSATYTFAFTSTDGRDDDVPGPKVNFDLNLTVKPVNIADVTTTYDADSDTYTMATTVIDEDKKATPPDTHSLDQLQRPLPGTPGQDPQADDDLVYKWYYADWDAKVELKNGVPVLEGTNTPIDTVKGLTSNHGLSYTPTANERGKSLYLVVTGQNNAAGAAMTPDRTKGELPLIVSYGAEIIVRENETQIKDEDGYTGGYTVYLWRTGTGDFDKDSAIPAIWSDATNSFKTADNALWPCDPDPDTTDKDEWTYEVYTNTVKGSDQFKKVDGVTIREPVASRTATVDYYELTLNETTYTNGVYEGKLTDTNKFFTAKNYKTGITPTAAVGGVAAGSTDTNKWVRKGEDIDLTEGAWGKDYTLAWTNATKQGTDAAYGGSSAKITSISAATEVDTKLTLKLYQVTAWVQGGGVVSEITMTAGTTVFSVNGTSGSIAAANKTGNIAGGNQVVFTVPEETYTLSATGATKSTTVEGYKVPHDGTDATTITVSGADTATRSYDVLISGQGQQMRVEDTNHDNPHFATASYSDKGYDGTTGHTITLDYNNYSAFTFPIKVTNTSTEQVEGDGGQHIYKVTAQSDPNGDDNASTITLDSFTAINDMAGGAESNLNFNIPAGLTAGTYTYTVKFSFSPAADSDATANATFKLTVVVEKLPFKTVNAVAKAGGGYESTEYTVDVQNAAGNDLKNDAETNLTHSYDYFYQWVTFPIGTTPSVTIESNGSLTVNGDKVGTDSRTYTPTADDQGKELRLVIYANSLAGNASGYAISDPVTLTYEGIVYVAVDGTTLTSATEPNPAYKVEFRAESETAIQGTWQAVSGATGKYAYVADLTPGKDYDVYVSRYAGDTTAADFVKIATLNGTSIGTALDHDPAFTNVTQAEYFTVHAQNFTEVAFKTGTGETFAAHVKPAVELESTDISVDGKPVLKNQSVQANVTGGWTQDYNLLWQSSKTGTDFDQTWKVKTATGKQTKTQAAADNAFTKTITEETYIGGRLDQNTYTVNGTVKNPDGMTGGSVGKVDLVFKPADDSDTRTFTFTTYHKGATPGGNTTTHVYETGEVEDKNSDGTFGEPGDAITFAVVRGSYAITATEGAQTTLQYVTIGGTGDSQVSTETKGPDRYTHTLTPIVADDTRLIAVYVAEKKLNLGLTDGTTSSTTQQNEAGATVGNNGYVNKDHTLYYDGTKTNPGDKDTFDLTLSNPTANGNGDLTVTASVYKFKKSDTIPNYDTGNWAGLTPGAISGGTYTDPDNSKVVITGLPSSLSLPVSDTVTKPGGSVQVLQDAANTADAIYVVRFTSVRTGTAEAGPTIYYKLDFTVNPLPIEAVKKPTANTTTGVLSVSSTDDFDDVTVSYMEGSTKQTADADERGLDDGDVIYVWAKAPANVTVTKDSFTLADNADIAVSATAAAAGVELVTAAGSSNTTYTPQDEEQGMNFYLLAVRNKANDSNASGFAVSQAMYAQVTIAMKAYQTGHDDGLTEVRITGVVDDESDPPKTASSNDGTLTVTENGQTILFNADLNDYLHDKDPGTADDPTKAHYYFVGWAADPTGGIGADSSYDLMTYSVTQQATVIGYYDKLPELTAPLGYDKTPSKESAANRTFHYTPHDGSGKLAKIVITGVIDGNTVTHELNSVAFEGTGFSKPAAGFGAEGNYVIPEAWIKTTAALAEGDYTVTFYDAEKGSLAEGGYAGYDRVAKWSITEGEKKVTAQVKDSRAEGADAPEYRGTVTISNGTVSQGPGTGGLTVETVGNKVNLTATPNDGYEFDKWETKSGTGEFEDTSATPVFKATSNEVTVEASFKAGTLSMEDQTAKVIYGNQSFEGTAPQMTATSTAEGESFKYSFVPMGELAGAGITDATPAPTWLKLNDDGTFGFNSPVDTNVESSDPNTYTPVANELVVYVKATAEKTGVTIIKKVTIDVEPGKLAVTHADGLNDVVDADGNITTSKSTERGDAYIAANTAAGNPVAVDENGVPKYNETVLKYLFTYVNVHDQADTEIDATGTAGDKDKDDSGAYEKGTWSVKPGKFEGTDAPSTYTFTFRYMPNDAEKKWNYTAAVTDMTLTIAKPPVGAEFADIIGNFADVENVLKPGSWTNGDDSDYSAVAKPEDYNGTFTTAPEEMDYTEKTFRKNETITYLDKEPTYTVKLKSVDDDIHGVELTVESKGFTVGDLPTFADGTFDKDDGVQEITLKLAAMEGNIWANDPEDADDIHSVKITLTGYSSAEKLEEGGEPDVTATYELTVKVLPKKISAADVTDLDPAKPGQTPDTTPTVTAKGEDGQPIDKPTEPDKYGNTPITPAVEWEDKDGNPVETFEEGGEYTVTVTLTPDPNYVFEDKKTDDPDDPDDAPNYTMDDKGDKDWTDPDVGDPNLTVEKTEDGEVILEKVERADVINIGANFKGFSLSDAGKPVSDYIPTSKDETKYPLKNETYGDGYVWATKEEPDTPLAADTKLENGKTYVLTVKLDPNTTDFDFAPWDELIAKFNTNTLTHEDDLTGKTQGVLDVDADGNYTLRYSFTVPNPGGGGGGVVETCPCKVHYYVGIHGTTTDATIEDVSEKNRPSKVPTVTALDGYTFRGWSLTNPATLKQGEQPTLVDPKTVEAKGETMTFYAVIVKRPYHEHYVVGYPNGNFGPADDITRASVATIIARAVLPDFVEGMNYGNPGGYSDVSGHWGESAIAYCSKFDVFKGYTDGTFRPDQPITRQEFALVMARLDGVMEPGEMDFTDIDEAGIWALGGIYTAYQKGWVNGYPDGTFKPLNNIRRDEAVKVFNAYLHRSVDADGLMDLSEYVHGSSTGNGMDEYMTWPDVPASHWAYYEIVEAANDHEFTPDFEAELGYTLPEHWEKCWISERWRTGAASSAAMVSAGFRVWLH